MDVLRELQEIRAINARVEQLEREGADPAQIRRAMQVAIKPGENGLSYQTRVLLYSYASDLIAAEMCIRDSCWTAAWPGWPDGTGRPWRSCTSGQGRRFTVSPFRF